MRSPVKEVLAFFLVLFIPAILVILSLANPVLAYSIVIDGDPTGWSGNPPPYANLGHISRNPEHHGEYIWKDLQSDERHDFSNPDPQVDLTEFRITADQEYLYFLVKMTDIQQSEGDGAPQIQVAIDMDLIPESGEIYLGGYADTSVDPNAAWENLIITRFGSSNIDLLVWKDHFGTQINTGSQAINTETETIEFSVPWTVLDLEGPPPQPLRFTVATFRSNSMDETWDIMYNSDALDTLTNYGNPGTNTDTWNEVSDGTLNYYFDVWFEADGDVYSPLLINEILYDPSGIEPDTEFIEIYNTSPYTLNLSSYKLGDEETLDDSEGMLQFPSGSIPPGAPIVLANDANAFFTIYNALPNYAIQAVGLPVPIMIPYISWSTANTIELSNSGDEVVLLDGQDTVLDIVEYEDSEPEWTDLTGTDFIAFEGYSMERIPPGVDTNNISNDFTTIGDNGTPGQIFDFQLFLPIIIQD